ncbi:Apolipoprotein L3 [Oryzias melastigma]|uniref:Apolipoprotein L3 n=1 Tax=Oryzias melastigma TaxID=30732 RepID=A0A834BSQ3_ORYME|nr:Apolipoprotein L3 [Oryzias melastigma]
MGSQKSKLQEEGYKLVEEKEKSIIATKDDETFYIKKIHRQEVDQWLDTNIESLKKINHPNILELKAIECDGQMCYIVMDFCHGGSLAEKIKEGDLTSSQILSWFVEIIVALKTLGKNGFFHKDLTPQFSQGFASSSLNLIPKIISEPNPELPKVFPSDLRQLLREMLEKNPEDRPTADEIIGRPFVLICLLEKCKATVEKLQTKINALRDLADGLETVHEKTSIGSLAGGVIGVVGGITSIVGLILTPFTLGASLIVTGVGVGVGAVGGITAGASNITKMVKQTSQREAVDFIIKEIDQKTKAIVTWLQEIFVGIETIDSNNQQTLENDGFNNETLKNVGFRAGRSLGFVSEAVRLGRVLTIGKIAAQTSRVVRVAEVATGVLSALFVAVDVFFIAMDAKEIHHIRQAKASTASDQNTLLPNPEKEDKSSAVENIKSEIMKFVMSIRNSADELQKVVDELKNVMSTLEIDPDEEQEGITQNCAFGLKPKA